MIKQLQLGFMIFCAMLLWSQTVSAKSNAQSLDRIVAIVNDAVITQSESDKAILGLKNQMLAANVPIPAADVLRKQVLDQMVSRKLQLQAADQAGIRVKDDQLDKTIGNIAAGNKMSVAELYQRITAQGLAKEDYRKEIREELILQQIEQQAAGAKISVTPEEVKSFLRGKSWQKNTDAPAIKEYRIEDLIVLLPDAVTPDVVTAAKKQADELLTKIRQGTSYSAIATAYANDKSIEQSDLGWRKLAEIPSAFAAKIAEMKKNDILDPIQTANGFHIIHLVDARNTTGTNNIAAPTESEAQQMIFQRKMEDSIKKWVAKLRSQAVINMQPEV